MKNLIVLIALMCYSFLGACQKDTIIRVLPTTDTTDIRVQTGVTITRTPHSPAPGGTTNLSIDSIPISGNIDFVNGGKGANSFYSNNTTAFIYNIPNSATAFSSMDNDVRFMWSQLQPTSSGVYKWTDFDAAVQTSIQRGQKLSFRILGFGDEFGSATVGGNKLGYPTYVHTQMQTESTKDWIANGLWIPNWNSNNFLTAVEVFLKALSSHINSTSYLYNSKTYQFKDAIYKIDIGMYGRYGEWHMFGAGLGSEPAGTLASDASLERIVNAYITAFPTYPLVGNINMFVDNSNMTLAFGYYMLTTSNAWGKFGFRTDHLGDVATYGFDISKITSRSYNGVTFSTVLLSRWQEAPWCGEPMNDAARVLTGGSSYFYHMETEIRNFHLAQFSNQNGTGQTNSNVITNYINSSKACGFRYKIVDGSYSAGNGKLTLTTNWANIGITPTYENWNVWIELRQGSTVVYSGKSSMNLKTFLPGTRSVTDVFSSIPAGTYNIFVVIRDPNAYRTPMSIANVGRDSGGGYQIGTLTL